MSYFPRALQALVVATQQLIERSIIRRRRDFSQGLGGFPTTSVERAGRDGLAAPVEHEDVREVAACKAMLELLFAAAESTSSKGKHAGVIGGRVGTADQFGIQDRSLFMKKTAKKAARAPATSRTANKKSYERIQVAALSLFAENGVESTSIRDIGNKAKVPTSLLYHYAPSKFQLVFELMSDGMERYQQSAFDARALGRTPEERLAGLITAHIIMHCRNSQLARLIGNGWRPLPKKEKDIMLTVRDNYSRLWDEVLQEGVRAGVFTLENPRLARLSVVQMCSVSQWYQSAGPLSAKELVQHFGDLVFATVRATRGGKPIRFAEIERPVYEDVLAIVEQHHRGAVFGRKR
jgi:TetR/AcrR family transcriptional regulator, cholesterol catabolism regulator